MSAEIGVAVRKGTPKPDISSVEAFKPALLDAKSVAYLRNGPSSVYLQALIPKLGIAEQISGKVKIADMDVVSKMIADGDAEIGVIIIPNIMNV
jgi:molybdate transport system substrate-binding protein